VSHASTRVAAVVTRQCNVGLDLETVSDALPARDLRRWTATEATLKAAGLGLRSVADVALDVSGSSAFLHGRRYEVGVMTLAPDVVASVASEVPLQLQSFELRLDAMELSTTVECSLRLATQV
jgi:phosphopantetheinyl transferase